MRMFVRSATLLSTKLQYLVIMELSYPEEYVLVSNALLYFIFWAPFIRVFFVCLFILFIFSMKT